jgi:hypothetical protein
VHRTLNIAPRTDRMMIANTDMTMHDQALKPLTTGFMIAAVWLSSDFVVDLV